MSPTSLTYRNNPYPSCVVGATPLDDRDENYSALQMS